MLSVSVTRTTRYSAHSLFPPRRPLTPFRMHLLSCLSRLAPDLTPLLCASRLACPSFAFAPGTRLRPHSRLRTRSSYYGCRRFSGATTHLVSANVRATVTGSCLAEDRLQAINVHVGRRSSAEDMF